MGESVPQIGEAAQAILGAIEGPKRGRHLLGQSLQIVFLTAEGLESSRKRGQGLEEVLFTLQLHETGRQHRKARNQVVSTAQGYKGLGQIREARQTIALAAQGLEAPRKGTTRPCQFIVITVKKRQAGRKRAQHGQEIVLTEEVGDLGRNRGQRGQLEAREVERTRGPCVDSIEGSLVASGGVVHGGRTQQPKGTKGTSIFSIRGSLNPAHPIWNNDGLPLRRLPPL